MGVHLLIHLWLQLRYENKQLSLRVKTLEKQFSNAQANSHELTQRDIKVSRDVPYDIVMADE